MDDYRDLQFLAELPMPHHVDTHAPSEQPSGIPLAPGVYVPESSIRVAFVRASGPGGQHVNTRATKAQMRISIDDIPLKPDARARLERMMRNAINDEGELIIQDDSTRSPSRNRRACMDRLKEIVARSVIPPKKRRPTKPTKGSVRRRLDAKKQRSETKRRRRPPED